MALRARVETRWVAMLQRQPGAPVFGRGREQGSRVPVKSGPSRRSWLAARGDGRSPAQAISIQDWGITEMFRIQLQTGAAKALLPVSAQDGRAGAKRRNVQ